MPGESLRVHHESLLTRIICLYFFLGPYTITLNGIFVQINNSNKGERKMKKLFLLTSVLAIAACGGGGGGSGGGGVAPTPLSDAGAVRAAFLTGAPANANTELTSMTSAIVVRDDNSEPAIYRSAARHYNDKDYTVYELSDIEFHIAENPAGSFKFTVDDHGTITEISETLEGGTVDHIQRIGTSQRFNTPIFEYVQDKYAKVGEDVFTMTNDEATVLATMKSVLENRYGLHDGTWVKEANNWRYKNSDESYAEFDQTTMISDNIGAMEMEIEKAYNFSDGKWVVVGENLQYQEYGDKALKRVADTGQDMDALDAVAPSALGHWNRIDEVLDISTEGEAVGLTFSDFGRFNPVYRSKHKGLDSSMISAIRNQHAADLDDALDADKSSDEILSLSITAGMRADADAHDYKTAAERETEFNTSEDFQLFAGGYAIKDGALVDSLTPGNNTSYTGTAIGRVYTSIQSNGVDRTAYLHAHGFEYDNNSGDGYVDANKVGHDVAKSFKTNAATLTVDGSGNQTIYMPFFKAGVGDDKFYNVTITGDSMTLDALNAQNEAHEDMIDSRYQVYGALDHIVDAETNINSGFYGVETPSEAAGTARMYSEENLYESGSNYVTREYELQAAWGMKKD